MKTYEQIAEKAMDRYYGEVAKVGAVPDSFEVTSEEFSALLRNNDLYQMHRELGGEFVWHVNNGTVLEVINNNEPIEDHEGPTTQEIKQSLAEIIETLKSAQWEQLKR